jgi:hypothetical protein
MSLTESQVYMADSKFIYVNTSKLYVDKTYKEIPSFKPVRKTRLFTDEKYDEIPGIGLYKKFSYYFGNNIVSIDRTNTIITPFKTTLAPFLSMPEYEKQDLSYSECCDNRAKELLSFDKTLYVMYSGGIDSTTMLSALLNNSTKNQQKKINVLLSSESITNNQKFYDDIICGNLNTIPSYDFDNYIGVDQDSIFVTAENNDELFGTNLVSFFIYRYDCDILFEEPTVSNLFKVLEKKRIISSEEDKEEMRKCIDLMLLLAEKSPVKLDTIYKLFWWLNFSLMWNVSYTRLLGFVKYKTYPECNFHSFFSTKEFQLWSMNNVDNLIGSDWKTAKQHAKDYINEYYKNDHYRVSAVPGSNLSNICYNKPAPFAIGTDMIKWNIGDSIDHFIEPNNSFL